MVLCNTIRTLFDLSPEMSRDRRFGADMVWRFDLLDYNAFIPVIDLLGMMLEKVGNRPAMQRYERFFQSQVFKVLFPFDEG